MIEVQCSGCGVKMKGPDSAIGRRVKCPKCGTAMLVEPPPDPYAPPAGLYDDVFDPEVVEEPDEYAIADAGTTTPSGAAAGAQDRRPCSVCGEMIVATAAKCRFCGEIFDDALRARRADPETVRQFRRNIHGLGGVWIFFGIVCVLIFFGARAAAEANPGEQTETYGTVAVVFVVLSVVWLISGIGACLKQLWAVYVGMGLCYINVLGSILTVVGTTGRGGSPIGGAIGLVILIVILIQGHRTLKLADQLKRMRVPLTAKP